MLKLYTYKSLLTEAYRSQVFPLLFDLVYQEDEELLKKYRIVESIEEADLVVLPINYTTYIKQKNVLNLISLAKQYKKPVWVYTAGDYGFTNYIKNSHTFRLGGFNSRLDSNTRVMPSFINDPYDAYLEKAFIVLPKPLKPSIGFVGHAQSGFVKYMKEVFSYLKHEFRRRSRRIVVDKQPFYPSSSIRAKYLKKLKAHKGLDTQFILRNKYRAGLHSKHTQKESIQQFYNNIQANAYTFCVRGVGNFSVRLYETLAVGRIPILLNTDCRLPLDDEIDWMKHCVIIDEKNSKTMEEQIIAFHSRLSNLQFENLQQENRDLWLNTLRRGSYFLHIYKQFKIKTV